MFKRNTDPKIIPEQKIKKNHQLLRGMKDILPEEQRYWNYINREVSLLASAYGYDRIDTPILEETALFVRSVGEDTDIVEKEMYSFRNKSGESVSLRPENTAGVVRAYIEHGMLNRPQPVKLFYSGPFFRHDRPQAGRYRQFHQFGFEAIGDGHPVIDAQIMIMAYKFYSQIGLPITLQVNSVGGTQCRTNYKKALSEYYKTRKNSLCDDCKKRLQKNPLRLLDCKNPDCITLSQDAPQLIDYLSEEYNEHFVQVLEHVDAAEIPYVLNTRLVRGLDYYTGTVFEIWPTPADNNENRRPSAQNSLGGGGRYDTLAKILGSHSTPGMGFAGGIERLIIELKNKDIKVGQSERPDVFVAQLGDAARKKSLLLFEELRQNGLTVVESFSKNGIKSQMEFANKRGAKFALILGQKEILDGTIIIRDMESGLQETVDFGKVITEIRKRLEKFGVVEKRESHVSLGSVQINPSNND